MNGDISHFKYVPIKEIDEWEANGWELLNSLNGCHHGQYAVLCRWKGDGEPKCP